MINETEARKAWLAGATHYTEATPDFVLTWFKKDVTGRWLGRCSLLSEWSYDCGYEECSIKPITELLSAGKDKFTQAQAQEMYEFICAVKDAAYDEPLGDEAGELLKRLESNDE